MYLIIWYISARILHIEQTKNQTRTHRNVWNKKGATGTMGRGILEQTCLVSSRMTRLGPANMEVPVSTATWIGQGSKKFGWPNWDENRMWSVWIWGAQFADCEVLWDYILCDVHLHPWTTYSCENTGDRPGSQSKGFAACCQWQCLPSEPGMHGHAAMHILKTSHPWNKHGQSSLPITRLPGHGDPKPQKFNANLRISSKLIVSQPGDKHPFHNKPSHMSPTIRSSSTLQLDI